LLKSSGRARLQELGKQLEALVQAASPSVEAAGEAAVSAAAAAAPPGAAASKAGGGAGAGRGPLPGLQDLRGHWSGAFQAYGGGGGATAVDFNLRGREWQWGAYELRRARARRARRPVPPVLAVANASPRMWNRLRPAASASRRRSGRSA